MSKASPPLVRAFDIDTLLDIANNDHGRYGAARYPGLCLCIGGKGEHDLAWLLLARIEADCIGQRNDRAGVESPVVVQRRCRRQEECGRRGLKVTILALMNSWSPRRTKLSRK